MTENVNLWTVERVIARLTGLLIAGEAKKETQVWIRLPDGCHIAPRAVSLLPHLTGGVAYFETSDEAFEAEGKRRRKEAADGR